MNEETDFVLLDRWASGDPQAGDALFRRYYTVVYHFLRNKVGDELEDLMQEALLACVEASRSRFRREATFRAFLLQIARFRLYAYYRRRNRTPAFEGDVTSLRNLGPSPSEVLEQSEQAQTLLSGLRQLPIGLQTALKLHFWEDFGRSEMAALLEIPPGTVASRLRRAKETLREVLRRLE